MTSRIRHCVECPRCSTRYLVGFSPYGNGSKLVPTVRCLAEEYTLYCSCRRPAVSSRWSRSELRTCEVSKEVHRRGYGSADEVLYISDQPAEMCFDITKYLRSKPIGKQTHSR